MVLNRPKASCGLKNEQPVSVSRNSPEWVFRLKAQHGSTWSFRNQATVLTSSIPGFQGFPGLCHSHRPEGEGHAGAHWEVVTGQVWKGHSAFLFMLHY